MISEGTIRKIFYATFIFEVILLAGYLTISFSSLHISYTYALFNLSGEKNLPAVFSSLQLLLVGIIFISISRSTGQTSGLSPIFVLLLGLGFVFLAFDEMFSIHEEITRSFRYVEFIPKFKGGRGVWVLPYLSVGFVFFILSYKEFLKLWNMYRREARLLALGFTIFVVGAVGVEIIGYQYLMDESTPRFLYKLEVAVEEFMEMLGISIVLFGTLLLRQKTIR